MQKQPNPNSSPSPSSEIAHFIKQGYLLYQLDDIKQWNDALDLDVYLKNILDYRRKIKQFFELHRDQKQFFQAKNSDFNHEAASYFPGWWDEFSYNDRIAHVNYSPEYLMSNNHYNPACSTLFAGPNSEALSKSEGENEKVEYETILPNQEGRDLCNFFHENILTRVREELATAIDLNLPAISALQCVMIYYDKDKILSKHTDEVFLSAHIGPTDEGLLIYPAGSDQPVSVTLDVGEVLLFFGREFEHEAGLLGHKISKPLPHYAEAKKGRLTMALSTFIESPR